jgi:hypothetical protein
MRPCHTAVAIAVRDEHLVGLRVHERVGRALHAFGIGVATALVVASELEEKPALRGELQQHVIGPLCQRCGCRTAATDPHVVFVIDKDSVLAVGPVEACRGAAPGVDKLSGGVQFNHRWRRLPAVHDGPRTMQDPDVIVAVHRDGGRLTQSPLVREVGPGRIDLKHRHLVLLTAVVPGERQRGDGDRKSGRQV